ncbi:AAA family ATPase [Pontibacter sp. G13]|uniref:AAA family ATPase n=1 Tax=Pontibacter sp. G13 TaxID=3074898 RepID=UPI00288A7940|nr:AAA family ATPase [Pontibacter sp. G13]WNJ19849.1 AAA family ATPase [Pontibacter sp. G13]
MNWTFPGYEIDIPLNWAQLTQTYPWIADMQGVPQDPEWHAEGDVYVHTQMVAEALIQLQEFQQLGTQEKHILLTSALLHDVEKRSTTTTEVIEGANRIVSPKHAKKGEFTTRKLLYMDIPTPFEIREQIAKLVRLHGLPLWAIQKPDPRKAVIEASLVVNTKHVAMLAKADVMGRICRDQEELLLRIELFEELCREHDCWGKPRTFASDYGRFQYLNRTDCAPDYEPFDDLKFEVTVMCALPGSGKDTYIQRHLDLPMLSIDAVRREHKLDPTDKKENGRAIQLTKEQAKIWMRARQSFVFNATNITASMRGRWISLFTDYGARVRIIYLEVPYRQLLSQNRSRSYQVPVKAIDSLIGKLEIPHPKEAHEILFVVE